MKSVTICMLLWENFNYTALLSLITITMKDKKRKRKTIWLPIILIENGKAIFYNDIYVHLIKINASKEITHKNDKIVTSNLDQDWFRSREVWPCHLWNKESILFTKQAPNHIIYNLLLNYSKGKMVASRTLIEEILQVGLSCYLDEVPCYVVSFGYQPPHFGFLQLTWPCWIIDLPILAGLSMNLPLNCTHKRMRERYFRFR